MRALAVAILSTLLLAGCAVSGGGVPGDRNTFSVEVRRAARPVECDTYVARPAAPVAKDYSPDESFSLYIDELGDHRAIVSRWNRCLAYDLKERANGR